MTMSRQNKSILKPDKANQNRVKPNKVTLYIWLALVCCWWVMGGGSPCLAAGMVIDNHGRQIEVKTPFKRIISLYGAHTENLFSLGLEAQIIGVSVNDSFPAQALDK